MFKVIETPCYPNKWKVERDKWPTNSICDYCADREKAEQEAARRNEKESSHD